ncbi:hypothetical protein FRX31_024867 [Thalictrum thalictroides]|uniref:Uncharacterized protein n=1 Tax=Thalictrum thalictroides TaxID=46969 RepID=A0A7J6VK96_THATH|nr:hypothetical protein FRX31_024867 [Thalictrum thalictroides]
MAGEIVFGVVAGIVGLSATTLVTVGLATLTKEIWDNGLFTDNGFGTGNVREDQARDLANQIKNLAKNINELKSDSHSVGVTVSPFKLAIYLDLSFH